jgi:hypothetical protein
MNAETKRTHDQNRDQRRNETVLDEGDVSYAPLSVGTWPTVLRAKFGNIPPIFAFKPIYDLKLTPRLVFRQPYPPHTRVPNSH